MNPAFPFLVAILLWLSAAPNLQAQLVFSTRAGTAGQPGVADGPPGISRFNQPSGIAADSTGTLFVADTANHTIRKITRSGPTWVVTTLAGSPGIIGNSDGAGSAARFNYPYGLAVGSDGVLFVADTYNHTIRQVAPSGNEWVVTTLAGSPGVHGASDGTRSAAKFYYPYGITVDAAGSIFVADSYNHTIRMVSEGGGVTTVAGMAGVTGIADGTNAFARFNYPSGIAVDGAGNLVLADTYNSIIRKITLINTDWVTTTLAGLPRYSGSADGTNRFAQFSYPFGVAVHASGTLYVADTVNHTLRAVGPAGTNWAVSTIGGLPGAVGTADGAGSVARFNFPYALAVDGEGNVFVADTQNHTIRFGQPGFSLQGLPTAGQLVLSWPIGASNYVLETSTSLVPGAAWNAITSGITISGDRFVTSTLMNAGPAFFRLRLP